MLSIDPDTDAGSGAEVESEADTEAESEVGTEEHCCQLAVVLYPP